MFALARSIEPMIGRICCVLCLFDHSVVRARKRSVNIFCSQNRQHHNIGISNELVQIPAQMSIIGQRHWTFYVFFLFIEQNRHSVDEHKYHDWTSQALKKKNKPIEFRIFRYRELHWICISPLFHVALMLNQIQLFHSLYCHNVSDVWSFVCISA